MRSGGLRQCGEFLRHVARCARDTQLGTSGYGAPNRGRERHRRQPGLGARVASLTIALQLVAGDDAFRCQPRSNKARKRYLASTADGRPAGEPRQMPEAKRGGDKRKRGKGDGHGRNVTGGRSRGQRQSK